MFDDVTLQVSLFKTDGAEQQKISDQVRAWTQREDIEWRRKVKLAGWFANFKEFSQAVRSHRVETVVV